MISERDRRVAELYREGKTHAEIADAVGTTVRRSQELIRRLRKSGVDLGPPRGPNPSGLTGRPSPLAARVIELYHAGYLSYEIAKDVGETTRRVKALIKQLHKNGDLDTTLAGQKRAAKRPPPKDQRYVEQAALRKKSAPPPRVVEDTSKRAIMPQAQQDALYAAQDYSGHDIEEGPVNLRYLPPPPPLFSLLRSQME